MTFPTTYNPALAEKILERLAAGETLTAICKGKEGMPHPLTFRKWIIRYPELATAYRNAITASAQSLEEEALDIARAISLNPKDGSHVRAMEVRLNQLRWSMERRDAARYGSKSQVSIKVPIQIITPLNLGAASQDEAQDIYTLEAVTVKEPPELPPEPAGRLALPPPAAPRKVTLTPRNPFHGGPNATARHRDYGKKSDKGSNVRQQGGGESNRQEHGGPGQGVRGDQEPVQQGQAQHAGEDTQTSGASK